MQPELDSSGRIDQNNMITLVMAINNKKRINKTNFNKRNTNTKNAFQRQRQFEKEKPQYDSMAILDKC